MSNNAGITQKKFQDWKIIEEQLVELFKIREKKETVELMDKGLSLFYEALYVVNGQEISYDEAFIGGLIYKPINVEERMNFIKLRRGSFHSFIQLGELFKELEKQYAKKASLEKKF
jgi:hypothetical protein